MKVFLLCSLLLTSSSFAADLPKESFSCTSTAKFFDNSSPTMKDVQVAVAGYRFPVFTGLQGFRHSYLDHTVFASIQIGIGSSHENPLESFSYADYFLQDGPVGAGKTIKSASFNAIGSPLPEKFGLSFFQNVTLSPTVEVSVSVVCVKIASVP